MAFPVLTPIAGDTDITLQAKAANSAAIALGAWGADTYNAPGQHTGEWNVVTALQDSQVAFRSDGVAEIVFLSARSVIYGKFTTLEAITGVIRAHRVS